MSALIQPPPMNKQLVTADGTVGTYTLTVPSGYTNMRISVQGMSSAAAGFDILGLRFNGDTSGSYDDNTIFVSGGGAPGGGNNVGNTSISIGFLTGSTGPANLAAGCTVMVPAYSNTTFHKTFTNVEIDHPSTSNITRAIAGYWHSTAAITSITVLLGTGNFVSGTTISVILS